MRILYVEDNLANLSLVQRLARIGDHEVISHPDGETALANMEQDKPDLILMDVQLKGTLTGLEVVKALRARGNKTPIIALTAYAMVGDRERCLEAGCDDYLPKPLPVEQLVEFFQRYDPKTDVASTLSTQPTPANEARANALPVPTVTPAQGPASEVKAAETGLMTASDAAKPSAPELLPQPDALPTNEAASHDFPATASVKEDIRPPAMPPTKDEAEPPASPGEKTVTPAQPTGADSSGISG
jgi:CheY-like chemotaxis protein